MFSFHSDLKSEKCSAFANYLTVKTWIITNIKLRNHVLDGESHSFQGKLLRTINTKYRLELLVNGVFKVSSLVINCICQMDAMRVTRKRYLDKQIIKRRNSSSMTSWFKRWRRLDQNLEGHCPEDFVNTIFCIHYIMDFYSL